MPLLARTPGIMDSSTPMGKVMKTTSSSGLDMLASDTAVSARPDNQELSYWNTKRLREESDALTKVGFLPLCSIDYPPAITVYSFHVAD